MLCFKQCLKCVRVKYKMLCFYKYVRLGTIQPSAYGFRHIIQDSDSLCMRTGINIFISNL
jgi:hypothetical protein